MSKIIKIGGVCIGGGNPIAVQSMTTTDAADIQKTVAQIKELQAAGCDIVRVAVPDKDSAEAVENIKKSIDIPLVADIHFDYKLAIMCMERGADKIRINPGNIGDADRVKQVADMARSRKIPIRIGVNGGSLEGDLLDKADGDISRAMGLSAERNVKLLNKFDFDDIVISVKSSSVIDTISAYRLISKQFDYPLHLGVTEAGTEGMGIIKSAIGIGSLLADGIGDTVRVSLTANPVEEVKAAKLILKALSITDDGIEVISCPTCGRCKIDIIGIANRINYEVEKREYTGKMKVAVMGCVVNGPGEAKDADIGIAGGDGCAALFKKGVVVGKIPEDKIVEVLLKEIEEFQKNGR